MSADEILYSDGATGAARPDRVAAEFAKVASDTIRVLHHRRMRGARIAIDHIAVTPGAVWVVQTERYAGRPQLRVEGRLVPPRVEKLMVGRYDQTALLAGVQAQIDRVEARMPEVPVRGALCFVETSPPLFGGAFSARGVDVVSTGRLAKLLRSTAVGPVDVAAATIKLARLFPPA